MIGEDKRHHRLDNRRAADADAWIVSAPGHRLDFLARRDDPTRNFLERANERLKLVVPATLLIIFFLLYLTFGRLDEAVLIMLVALQFLERSRKDVQPVGLKTRPMRLCSETIRSFRASYNA